jgi:hypothetical protein
MFVPSIADSMRKTSMKSRTNHLVPPYMSYIEAVATALIRESPLAAVSAMPLRPQIPWRRCARGPHPAAARADRPRR